MGTFQPSDNFELRQQFQKGRLFFKDLENSSLSCSSLEYQNLNKEAIRAFTKASLLISKLGVFSPNETAEDISTGDLKYLLVDAYLGELYYRIIGTDRLKVLESSEGYFKTYLTKLDRLELLKKEDRDELESIEKGVKRDPTRQREHKILKFKRERDVKMRLQDLEARLPSDTDAPFDETRDDELDREYIITILETFVHLSINQIDMIQQEIPMAKMLQLQRESGQDPTKTSASIAPPPLKPIVIKDTRSIMREQVFQPGWRQPTMTLDEFLELERQRGNILEGGGVAQETAMRKAEEEKLYRDSDASADEETYKQRKWDEYTDDHRPGEGNIYNRS